MKIKFLWKKLVKENGVTLAELTVAALVLVTILVGVLSSYVTSLDLNETSRNTTLAVNAAKQKIAEIKDHSFSNIYTDFHQSVFTLSDMPLNQSRGIIYVYVDPGCGTTTDYDLLRVVISVCWRQKSGRVIGEDINLNGILDAGEDDNSNGQIDSPAQLVTLIAP